MGGMCVIYREVEQCVHGFGGETQVKCPLVGVSVGGSVILHKIRLKSIDWVWTRLIWFRLVTNGRLLELW
jgi:hypothetical protein